MTPGRQSITEVLMLVEGALQSTPQAEIPTVLGHLEKAKALAWGRLHAAPRNGQVEGELLTVPEVAQRLKVSKYRAYELVRQGEINDSTERS